MTMAGTLALSDHLAKLMMYLDISATELARVLQTSDRTVIRWLADETYPQHDTRKKLESLDALVQRLRASFESPEAAVGWLHARSGYFGGLRPLDALLSGRIDAVDSALEAMDAGVFV
jgi:hypothetical protein